MKTTICAASALLGLLGATVLADDTRYAIIDLGTLGGPDISTAPGSIATSVNAAGEVVGTSVIGDMDGTLGAFMWTNGAMSPLLPYRDVLLVRASAISESGIVVGVGYDLGDTTTSAMRWDDLAPTNLGLFDAVDVNDAGHVVGRRMVPPMFAETMAVADFGSGLIDLGTLGGPTSTAYGLDETDRVVGSADDASRVRRPYVRTDTLHDLGTLGGPSGEAMQISTSGWIAGWSQTADGRPHATRWRVDSAGVVLEILDLGELSGGFSYAYDVDEFGRCVGTSDARAFLWENGAIVDLNTLVSPELVWTLHTANAMSGENIVGHGRHLGQLRAFLMRPAEPADVIGNGIVNIDDLLAVIQAFGPCNGCAEDVNCNGDVNIDDLVAVLNAWTL